jgi:hypothetical protein
MGGRGRGERRTVVEGLRGQMDRDHLESVSNMPFAS